MADILWPHRVCFYDTETTGVDPDTCRIVQLAYKTFEGGKCVGANKIMINPNMEIEAGAVACHGITNDMVKEEPTFAHFAQELHEQMHGAYWGGYNIRKFDNRILRREFTDIGIPPPKPEGMLDAFLVFLHFYGRGPRGTRTLTAAHRHYVGCEFDGAHGADADVEAVIAVVHGMIDLHPEVREFEKFVEISSQLLLDIDRIGFFKFNQKREAVVNKGKFAGTPLPEIPKSYMNWLISADFPNDTKRVAEEALRGIYPRYKE